MISNKKKDVEEYDNPLSFIIILYALGLWENVFNKLNTIRQHLIKIKSKSSIQQY